MRGFVGPLSSGPTHLDLLPFSKQLIQSEDLDPVYSVLVRAKLPPKLLSRWLVAYWCFYSAGFASYASERRGAAYWSCLGEAAENATEAPVSGRWPRGTERRHFRGKSAVRAVQELSSAYRTAAQLVDAVTADTCSAVMQLVSKHYMFGDWIAFKVADMLDRVVHRDVSFAQAEVFMFDAPTRGAELACSKYGDAGQDSAAAVRWALGYLDGSLGSLPAPPSGDRLVGLQEYETCLCKWKSHVGGHYPVGKDCHELSEVLARWASVSDVAEELVTLVPSV